MNAVPILEILVHGMVAQMIKCATCNLVPLVQALQWLKFWEVELKIDSL